MTREEMLAALKDEHGIDVAVLQEKAAKSDNAVALSNKIQEQLVSTGLLKLSNSDEVDADTLIGAIAEAGNQIAELSGKVDDLIKDGVEKDAKTTVEALVLSGHILPKNKDAMVELRLSNKDLFDKLVPDAPVVKLSNESGTDAPDEITDAATVDSEVTRLTDLAQKATSVSIRS